MAFKKYTLENIGLQYISFSFMPLCLIARHFVQK